MEYLAGEGRWLRGNLHTHTTVSDGKLTPEECIRLYKEKGYDFLCITDHHNGTFHVDLKRANLLWLERSGLDTANIAVCSACTACDLETFWSHRRTGTVRGSMAAMICLPGREL